MNALVNIAKTYHVRCDRFDEGVCSGKNKYGEPMPANGEEYGKINNYSRQRRVEALEEGARLGFTKDEILQAISKYHLTHK